MATPKKTGKSRKTTRAKAKAQASPDPPGRPSKLSADVIAEAVLVIENGALLSMVPPYLGIAHSTFFDWLRRGKREAQRVCKVSDNWDDMTRAERAVAEETRKKETLFLEFSYRIQRAVVERDQALLGVIQSVATGKAKKKDTRIKKELLYVQDNSEENPVVIRDLIKTEETVTTRTEMDWQAARYLLEKGSPSLFGPRATLDVKQLLPTDPKLLADMELSELLELERELEARIDGNQEQDI